MQFSLPRLLPSSIRARKVQEPDDLGNVGRKVSSISPYWTYVTNSKETRLMITIRDAKLDDDERRNQVIQLVEEEGAAINTSGYFHISESFVNRLVEGRFWVSPLSLAITKNHVEIVRYLLDQHSKNNEIDTVLNHTKDRTNGFTPIHLAAYSGNPKMLRILLDHQHHGGIVDVNARTGKGFQQGWTALHLLVHGKGHMEYCCRTDQSKYEESMRLLLGVVGIDVNAVTPRDGYTSLHLACSHLEVEMAQILLNAKGINVHYRTSVGGETPLDIVRKHIRRYSKNLKLFSHMVRKLEPLKTLLEEKVLKEKGL